MELLSCAKENTSQWVRVLGLERERAAAGTSKVTRIPSEGREHQESGPIL